MHFKDSPSEATLFRIKEFPFKRNAELDLSIGSLVRYRKFYGGSKYWVEAQVIDFRQSGFGREARLKYFGFSTHSECRLDSDYGLRHGVSDWIPAESAEIGGYYGFGAPHRSRINEACGKYIDNFEGDQRDTAWIRKFKEYEFASVYQTVKQTLIKMESNRVWKESVRELRRSRLHQALDQNGKWRLIQIRE